MERYWGEITCHLSLKTSLFWLLRRHLKRTDGKESAAPRIILCLSPQLLFGSPESEFCAVPLFICWIIHSALVIGYLLYARPCSRQWMKQMPLPDALASSTGTSGTAQLSVLPYPQCSLTSTNMRWTLSLLTTPFQEENQPREIRDRSHSPLLGS